MKTVIACIVGLFAAQLSLAQTIKIVDAVTRFNPVLLETGPGSYSYCYTVKTDNFNKSSFRVYKFDSVARINAKTNLDLYGEYELRSHAFTPESRVVVAHSSSLGKLAVWFLGKQSEEITSHLLLTVPDRKAELQVVASKTQDLFFVLVTSPSKKNTSSFRVMAVSPRRVAWETPAKVVEGSTFNLSACDDKVLVKFMGKNVPVTTSAFNIVDGAAAELDSTSACVKKADPSYSVGRQVAIEKKKVIWVGDVTTALGSYLIGEEYTFDGTAGQVAAGALAAVTGVYGAVPSTLRLRDVIVQQLTDDNTNRPAPRIVPMTQRNVLMSSGLSPSVAASFAFATGRVRYLGADKQGNARFLGDNEVLTLNVDSAETSVFGRFDYKKVQSVTCLSRSGLVVKEIDEQTGVVTFRLVPFQ